MRIAQIVCAYPPYRGGIGTSALNIARVLKSAGNKVKTFTLNRPTKRKRAWERGGLAPREDGVYDGRKQDEVFYLNAIPRFGNGGVLPMLCWRLHDFDLVYLHYPFFGTAELAWFLKKFVWKKNKKLVIQYHMDTVLPNLFLKILSLPSALIFNSLFKNADLIISASLDYVQNSRLKNIYEKYPAKFREIPFGVDTEKFKPAEKTASLEESVDSSRGASRIATGSDGTGRDDKKMVGQNEAFKILFVGGLDRAHYFKGVDALLEAVSKIPPIKRGGAEHRGVSGEEGDKSLSFKKDWQLNIVGSGDLEEFYKAKARELGIADKVKFLGNVSDEDLPKKYQEADCFVLPSINKGEAFGIVLIEAMASGLPVIASDLPGVRGVFTAESGLKVKPGDAEDLAAKLKYLMDNPAECKKRGEAARREAEAKYGQEMVGTELIFEITNIK